MSNLYQKLQNVKETITAVEKEIEITRSIIQKLSDLKNLYVKRTIEVKDDGERSYRTDSGNRISYMRGRSINISDYKLYDPNTKQQDDDLSYMKEHLGQLVSQLHSLNERKDKLCEKIRKSQTADYICILDDIDIVETITKNGYINGELL